MDIVRNKFKLLNYCDKFPRSIIWFHKKIFYYSISRFYKNISFHGSFLWCHQWNRQGNSWLQGRQAYGKDGFNNSFFPLQHIFQSYQGQKIILTKAIIDYLLQIGLSELCLTSYTNAQENFYLTELGGKHISCISHIKTLIVHVCATFWPPGSWALELF